MYEKCKGWATVICKRCSKNLYRVQRLPLQRLLPGSRRFACPDCGRKYLVFLDLLCHYCNHALRVVPRQGWQRLILGSSRHECTYCGHRYIRVCGVLLSLPFSYKQFEARKFQSHQKHLSPEHAQAPDKSSVKASCLDRAAKPIVTNYRLGSR